MALLDKVKPTLRISAATTTFNDEVADIVNAAIADLRNVGIVVTETQAEGAPIDVSDPLILRAIILYAKSEFGYSEDAERFRKAYDYLKCSLSMSDDYTTEGGE